MKADNQASRIERALKLAIRFGGIDGDHHKAWVIDQMVRELTGCPKVRRLSPFKWTDDKRHRITMLGESEEYKELVREARHGELGPETYDWDEGICP